MIGGKNSVSGMAMIGGKNSVWGVPMIGSIIVYGVWQ